MKNTRIRLFSLTPPLFPISNIIDFKQTEKMNKRFVILIFGLLIISCSGENNFNSVSFKNRKYSKDQIMLFCDIAFRESNTVRKWETDIKIEIKDIESLKPYYISDIDSCIAILAPLIKPLKIQRVQSGGNISIVFMNRMPLGMGMAMGYTQLNNMWLSSNITHAELLILQNMVDASILLHELEHALGLAHPKRRYPYILNICGRESPAIFKTIDEYLEYSKNRYPISKQEKDALRMLYSRDFKSGLKRETFMKEMNITDDNIWK